MIIRMKYSSYFADFIDTFFNKVCQVENIILTDMKPLVNYWKAMSENKCRAYMA